MPHLNELNEKYRARGFEILAVSNRDTVAELEAFIKEKEIVFGIARVEGLDAYNVTAYPTSYALDVEGKVIWKGHPANLTDEMIEEWIKSLVPPTVDREVDKKLDKAVKAYDGGQYGDALNEAAKYESDANEKLAQDAKYVSGLVQRRIELRKQEAEKRKETGDYVKLFELLSEDAASFKGCEYGDEAKELAAEVKKSDEYKDCEKAQKDLEKIRPKLEDMRKDKAHKELSKIAEKYPNTPAGKEAAELAKLYE